MIFIACLLTVLIEAPFLALFGYRSREELIVIICTNVITNLLLNLAIAYVIGNSTWIYFMEVLVVALEYAVYAAAFGRSWKLFLLTLFANCLSYGLGLIIF